MKVKVLTLLIVTLLLISGCSNQSTEKASSQDSPRIVKVIIEKVDSSNFYVVNTAEGENLQYAFYVYKDDELLDKFNYEKDAHLSYTVKEPGSYKVKAYVKDENDKTVSEFTQTMEMEM